MRPLTAYILPILPAAPHATGKGGPRTRRQRDLTGRLGPPARPESTTAGVHRRLPAGSGVLCQQSPRSGNDSPARIEAHKATEGAGRRPRSPDRPPASGGSGRPSDRGHATPPGGGSPVSKYLSRKSVSFCDSGGRGPRQREALAAALQGPVDCPLQSVTGCRHGESQVAQGKGRKMKAGLMLLVGLAAFCAGCSDAPEKEQGSGTATVEVRTEGENVYFDFGDGVTMKLVLIPAGKFLMGSPETEKDRQRVEGPQHEVTISRPFYMGTTEVTQAQWKAVMGTEPWRGQSYIEENPEHAASYISWEDATAFCAKLSEKAGRTVRLPREAEWEYGCRSGSTTRFSYGDDPDYSHLGEYAWYDGNSCTKDQKYPHAAGQKKPNAWGLYDMYGNVLEWCEDCWHDTYQGAPTDGSAWAGAGSSRVVRGGSWYNYAGVCRSSFRAEYDPDIRYDDTGFRVVVCSNGAD